MNLIGQFDSVDGQFHGGDNCIVQKGLELFFIPWMGISKIIIPGIITVNSGTRDADEAVLFDFGTLDNMDDWLIVNDGVMGGVLCAGGVSNIGQAVRRISA